MHLYNLESMRMEKASTCSSSVPFVHLLPAHKCILVVKTLLEREPLPVLVR